MLSLVISPLTAPAADQAALSRFSAWTREHNKTYASHAVRNLALHAFVANEAVIAELQASEQVLL